MTLLERTETRGKNRALFVSAGLHVAAFWGLMSAPAYELPKRAPSEYQQILDSRMPERKITVYKFRKTLPPVTPPKTGKDRRPLRADVESKQAMVSSADAKRRNQMVWTPSPELAPTVPLESPNLIAVRFPEPGPKAFTAPPDIVRPAAAVEVPLPPEIEAQATAAPELKAKLPAREYRPVAAGTRKVASPVRSLEAPPELVAAELAASAVPRVKLPPKQYVAAPGVAKRESRRVTRADDAPELAAAERPAVAGMAAVRLPPRQYVAVPGVAERESRRVTRAGDVPELAATAPLESGVQVPGAKLPPKVFRGPASAGSVVSRSVVRAGDAPEVGGARELASAAIPGVKLPPRMFPGVSGAGRAATRSPVVDSAAAEPLDMVVVGLKPTEMEIALPAASSAAAFASGAKLNPKGAASEPGAVGLAVPDLFIRGPKPASATELIAQARLAPTSREMVAAAVKQGDAVMTRTIIRPANPGSGATKVMSAPDPRMSGREVYMMAIQMPNLTSYSGSWLMWYATRTANAAAEAPLAPPVAHRKVDPKYVQAAADEKIQGNVRLACVIDAEGNVGRVELLQGLDARLNQTAMEALQKWQFYPATRSGEPVAVDVVVEIPFRLAPKVPSRGQ